MIIGTKTITVINLLAKRSFWHFQNAPKLSFFALNYYYYYSRRLLNFGQNASKSEEQIIAIINIIITLVDVLRIEPAVHLHSKWFDPQTATVLRPSQIVIDTTKTPAVPRGNNDYDE